MVTRCQAIPKLENHDLSIVGEAADAIDVMRDSNLSVGNGLDGRALVRAKVNAVVVSFLVRILATAPGAEGAYKSRGPVGRLKVLYLVHRLTFGA